MPLCSIEALYERQSAGGGQQKSPSGGKEVGK